MEFASMSVVRPDQDFLNVHHAADVSTGLLQGLGINCKDERSLANSIATYVIYALAKQITTVYSLFSNLMHLLRVLT